MFRAREQVCKSSSNLRLVLCFIAIKIVLPIERITRDPNIISLIFSDELCLSLLFRFLTCTKSRAGVPRNLTDCKSIKGFDPIKDDTDQDENREIKIHRSFGFLPVKISSGGHGSRCNRTPGNTTRISLLGKHVGRNRLLNTLIETETWAPMKGVCFKTCHLQYWR